MTLRYRNTRRIAIALLAALAVGLIAPTAEAGHRRWYGPAKVIRYKGYAPVQYNGYAPVQYDGYAPVRYTTRSEYVVRRSDNGAIVAGFLGGLFLGAVLANQAPHGMVYYDASCGRSFARLDLYESYCSYYRIQPRVVRVVEIYPGYDHCPPPGYGYGYGYSGGGHGCDDQGWDEDN